MKEKISYIVTWSVGAVIALLVCLFKDIFDATGAGQVVLILSDAFFASAVFLGGFGLLVAIANEGNFDALFYGIQILGQALRKEKHRKDISKNLFEYQQSRLEKRRRVSPMILAGLFYLLLAVICTGLFFVC